MQAQETYTIGQNVYTRHESGLFFPDGTPEGVKRALRNLASTSTRVRIFCGDTETGKTWSSEYDILGTVGRSMGPCRVPLLINNARSKGGGSILSHCVLGIASKSRASIHWHYKAANFDNGDWTAAPITETHNGKSYGGAVYRDGELYGRCETMEKAERLRAFMAGESFRK